MAIAFTLQLAARDRIVYLCAQDGVISSPPSAADGQATVNNFIGDVISGAAALDSVGSDGLLPVARASRDGFGPLAAGALTQAQIRSLMLSDDAAGAVLSNLFVGRCVERVSSPIVGGVVWNCDAGSDPASPLGNNDPSPIAISEVGIVSQAYLTVEYRHSRNR
jgi:hypothetical protein